MKRFGAIIFIVQILTCVMAACVNREITEVTLDEDGCNVEGPTQLPAGENSFTFNDLSGLPNAFYVVEILDDHTYEEVVNRQPQPGDYIEKPSWAKYAERISIPRPNDLAENLRFISYSLDEGKYFLSVSNSHPPTLWFCAPLEVTKEPTE